MSKTNNHPMLPPDWNHRSPVEKEQYLKSNADRIKDNQTVRRPLDDDEIDRKRYNLQEQSIELADLQSDYDEIKKKWREKINDAKAAVSETVKSLKQGYEETVGTTFELRDFEQERVYVFMSDGTEIDDRRMLPDEKQQTVQSGMRSVSSE